MKVEIIEHYQDVVHGKLHPNKGTFHAFVLVDIGEFLSEAAVGKEVGFDLRGNKYHLKSNGIIEVYFRDKKAYDYETKTLIYYPTLSFMNQKFNEELFQSIKTAFEHYAKSKQLKYSDKDIPQIRRKVKKNYNKKPNDIKSSGTFTKYHDWKTIQDK